MPSCWARCGLRPSPPGHGHRPRRPTAVAGRDAAVRRLAADRGVPTGMRVLLVLLLIYPVSPVDLVPDFLPNGGVRPTARLATHCRRGSDPGLVDKCGYAACAARGVGGDAGQPRQRAAVGVQRAGVRCGARAVPDGQYPGCGSGRVGAA